MSRRKMYRTGAPCPQAGFTLVELMVAITVGLILLLAVTTLFVNASRVFKSNDDFARMQENAAYAMNSLGTDLHHAGFYGLIGSTDVGIPPSIGSITVSNDCAPAATAWALTVAQPLFGFSGLSSAAAAAALPCIDANNFIASATDRPSFILIVRGATGAPVPAAALDNATLYVQSSPNGGSLFTGGQFNALGSSERRFLPDGADAPIYPYQAKAYYLRPCSRPSGGGTVCQPTDDGGQPIPTLVRQELSGTTMREVAVAEGVEAARVVYGIDTNADGAPELYTQSPSAAQFPFAVSVRVSLLVRSPKRAAYDDRTRSYDLDGDGSAELNCLTNGLPCDYHRHVFTQLFQVRNVAQRLEPLR